MTQNYVQCEKCKCFTCKKGPFQDATCSKCSECTGGYKDCPKPKTEK